MSLGGGFVNHGVACGVSGKWMAAFDYEWLLLRTNRCLNGCNVQVDGDEWLHVTNNCVSGGCMVVVDDEWLLSLVLTLSLVDIQCEAMP